jgi:hypothetical protein
MLVAQKRGAALLSPELSRDESAAADGEISDAPTTVGVSRLGEKQKISRFGMECS